MAIKILGIHHGHNSSATLLIDGEIIAAAPEERFSRVKNDHSFPINAINFCLNKAKLKSEDIDIIAIPDSYLSFHASTFLDLSNVINGRTLKQKLKSKLKKYFPIYLGINSYFPYEGELPLYLSRPKFNRKTKIHYCPHHLAHASSAYFTSGFNDSKVLIVTMDGIGGNISSALWLGENSKISCLEKYGLEGSIGAFYSNATEALGWRQGSDEWKLMGLAPYGNEERVDLSKFHPHYEKGYLSKPHKYQSSFIYEDGKSYQCHNPEAKEMKKILKNVTKEDFAAQVQKIAEDQALNFIIPRLKKHKLDHLACAGGCFLNIKLNGLLRNHENVKKFWTYPDSGDSGLSLGAAFHAHYKYEKATSSKKIMKLNHLYYGSNFTNEEIHKELISKGIKYEKHDDIYDITAKLLAKNLTIGWFQGSMEIGPRALGNRSILMSPINPENKNIINKKIKYREKFRPFCPSILEEEVSKWIKEPKEEKFMTSSFKVLKNQQSKIPAVVHIDGTMRPQFVSKETNSKFHRLINNFFKFTDVPILLNTSFNVKGEPIVCNPTDAIRCFYSCGLDALVMGDFLIMK